MDPATQHQQQRDRAHLLSLRINAPFTTESLLLHLQQFEETPRTAFPHCVRPKHPNAPAQHHKSAPSVLPVRWLFFLETLPESIARAVNDRTYSTAYADLRLAYIAVSCTVDELDLAQEYGPQLVHDRIAALAPGQPLLLVEEVDAVQKSSTKASKPKPPKVKKIKVKANKKPLGESNTHNVPTPSPGLFEQLTTRKDKPAPPPPLSSKVVPVERTASPRPVWSPPAAAQAVPRAAKPKPPRQPKVTVYTAAASRLQPKSPLSVVISFVLDPTATEHFVQRDFLPVASKGERVPFDSEILGVHRSVRRAGSLFLSPLGDANSVEVTSVYMTESKHVTRHNVLSLPRLLENGWRVNRPPLGADTLHHPASGVAFRIERLRGGEEVVLATSWSGW